MRCSIATYVEPSTATSGACTSSNRRAEHVLQPMLPRDVIRVHRRLLDAQYGLAAIRGDMEQIVRVSALEALLDRDIGEPIRGSKQRRQPAADLVKRAAR
jgi:hypothetical protein